MEKKNVVQKYEQKVKTWRNLGKIKSEAKILRQNKNLNSTF